MKMEMTREELYWVLQTIKNIGTEFHAGYEDWKVDNPATTIKVPVKRFDWRRFWWVEEIREFAGRTNHIYDYMGALGKADDPAISKYSRYIYLGESTIATIEKWIRHMDSFRKKTVILDEKEISLLKSFV